MDKTQFISGVTDKYDARLLEHSLTTEGNVCGVLLSDLTYFDDCGLESKDFITKHGRMLFTIGKQLREKGCANFDEITYGDSFYGFYRGVKYEIVESLGVLSENASGWTKELNLISLPC